LGYTVTRQTESHIRLTTKTNVAHHVTVPAHDPIKVGTLAGILNDISTHHKISKEELIQKIPKRKAQNFVGFSFIWQRCRLPALEPKTLSANLPP